MELSQSVIAGYRPDLFGLIREINHDLVDIAPSPPFRRIIAFHYRMLGLVKVLGCVLADRLIAAADVAAFAAETQMEPLLTNRKAFFAAFGAGLHISYRADVTALVGHR